MKEIYVQNTSDKDVYPYPIAEAQLDKDGRAIYDPGTGDIVSTGITLEWELKAGESKIFPEYVGKYLMDIYDFIVERPMPEDEPKDEVEEETTAESSDDSTTEKNPFECEVCGFVAKNLNGLRFHTVAKHKNG
jgi:hypothetical protein